MAEPKQFEIRPTIAEAEALPGDVYSDPHWHERAKEKIFARSWQLVDLADRVKAPGHVLPFTFLEGCLDEPLLLTVDDQTRAEERTLLPLLGIHLESQEWASIARFSVGTFVYAATIGVAFVSPELALALQFLLALYYLFEQLR